MSAAPSSSTLRLVAVVVFLALPAAALATGLFQLVAWRETEDLIARQEALLRDLDARLARTGADGVVAVDTRTLYLAAGSRPLAGADLQTRIGKAIADVGGKLVEAQVIDDPDLPPDAIDLKVTFDATNGGLLRLLHGLETGLPLMTVGTAAVRELPSQDGAGAEDPVLRIDLTVRAWFKAEA
ncbi:type II secretion system protein GspM [Oharaeibacter diazotrophicus]|uniref:General secretion pathway protein M n=1 Tax=Oharaeibacter diazotrophicus TaxID=1920512 RepID=A0A4R6R683_9HYPH|nr:type II secretion system protein GspM [Oharaeibacter diazotrophicus]TDP81451.1 general secretion pathway protein M [Oharaeibacter diazotrophicus]BBE73689.1 general secretion pathway protein M [Pleomorphomonas sp. SM30]GLS75478.1 hypothetical protein GCM10007904_08130 [Oharaeibacter diazotrophicus]